MAKHAWRVAKSLETLLAEINKAYPKRNKVSDGGIGDAAHQTRNSDHNPWVRETVNGVESGVVTARDFTHDPANGADMGKLFEHLRTSQHPSIKYVIFNRRIFASTVNESGRKAWVAGTYTVPTGGNPHLGYMHVSVKSTPSFYDSTRPWGIKGTPVVVPPIAEPPLPALGNGLDPVLIKVNGDTATYEVIAGAYRVKFRGPSYFRIMGFKPAQVVKVSADHPFAKLPIWKAP